MSTYQVEADGPQQSLEDLWPPFGLRIETPRLILRVLRDTDIPQYIAAATAGVTHTDQNPFVSPWNEKSPADLVRNSLPFVWSMRNNVGPKEWKLALAVFRKNNDDVAPQLIGMQDAWAKNWSVLRTVTSGSWLRSDQHGQGLGKEMRAGMLFWAFDHFGAEFAESGALAWNSASRRVSESLGYSTVGRIRVADAHGEKPEWEDLFRLPAADFNRPDWTPEVTGSDLLADFYNQQ